MLIGTDDDLARFADRRRRAVRQNEVDIVKRARDAHGAAFRHGADRVVNGKRGLRLAEALIDGKAGGALPLLVDLGVQGFACRGTVLDGGKVIFGEIFLNEEAVHSGRRAERGDVVLLEHRQDVVCIELIKIIGKNGRFTHPLAVELAPQRLAPAGIRNGEVQPLRVDVVPVFGSDVVSECVFIVVLRDLRVARGAGGEEHEHGVTAAGGVLCTLKHVALLFNLGVEIEPALACAVCHHQKFDGVAVFGGAQGFICDLTVRRADERAHSCGLEAVIEVVLH